MYQPNGLEYDYIMSFEIEGTELPMSRTHKNTQFLPFAWRLIFGSLKLRSLGNAIVQHHALIIQQRLPISVDCGARRPQFRQCKKLSLEFLKCCRISKTVYFNAIRRGRPLDLT